MSAALLVSAAVHPPAAHEPDAHRVDARTVLRADIVDRDVGTELLARLDAEDPSARLAGSPLWCDAAAAAGERLVHVALYECAAADATPRTRARGASAHASGIVVLARGHAGWRSGSPGQATLRWPMQTMGYGFAPRFAAHVGREARQQWLAALAARFPRTRFELRRGDDTSARAPAPSRATIVPGTAVWCATVDSREAWLAGLKGKHRRDLAKYRRDIAAAGGTWHDVDASMPSDELRARLSTLFALHAARLAKKGVRGAGLGASQQQLLRALAAATLGTALRLSLLQCDGRWIAGCLSFTWRGRYEAHVSGWSHSHPRLDLGRQVLYHQVLGELDRGAGVRILDFLGGDLDYKREFGLQRVPTVDAVLPANAGAAWRERLVTTALSAWRRCRSVRRAPATRSAASPGDAEGTP